jgi:MarR family transcriptional regulator, negative regulator of the multidrug operon emrRAB
MHYSAANAIVAAGQLIADLAHEDAQEVLELGGAAPAAVLLVYARPGLSLEELRHPLALSQPGMVRLVDRLESRGLLERQHGGGRRLALFLTPSGRRAAQRMSRERSDALDALVEPLSEDERAELVRLLEKMLVAHVLEAGDRERVCRLCNRSQCTGCAIAAAADAADERDRRLGELDLQLRLASHASEEELALLLADAERAGDKPAAAKAQARLGVVAMARADYDEVIARLEQAREYLSPLSDALAIAALARAYSLSGRADDAVRLLEEALAELDARAPGNHVAWVRSAVYLSYALTDDGRYAEARSVVRKAFRRSKGVPDYYTRARVHWSAARLAMFERELPTAERHFTRVVRLLEQSEDDRLLGRAHISRAMIRTLAGRLEPARADLRRAEALLGSNPDVEDLYWLLIEQGRQAVASGATGPAIAFARKGLALLGEGDAAARAAAHAVLARALAAQGDIEGADGAFAEAVATLRVRREWYAAAEAAQAWSEALRTAGRAADAERAHEVASQLAAEAAAASRRTPRRSVAPPPAPPNRRKN